MKRINKILWHGNEIPLPSAYEGSLDGLNRGELFIYEDDEDPAIFIKTNKNKVKRIGGSGGGGGTTDINEILDLIDQKLNGYATEEWVSSTYATKTALSTLSSSVNSLRTDFNNLNALLNDDVTGKINTWHEVVDFLDEYSGSQDLAAILSGMNTDIASRVEKSKFAEYFNSEMAKWFVKDDDNKGLKPANSYGLYSETYVSAKGVSTGTGGSGGSSYDRLDKWSDYTTDKAGWVLSALLGQDLNNRLSSLESGSALSLVTTGDGNAVTAIAKSGNQLTVTKGSTFQPLITSSNKLAYSLISGTPTSLPASDVAAWAKAASKPSYAFSEITNKPTTLGGYGITDALSTSGGMMTSNSIEVLSLNTKSASLYPAIGFYNNGTRIGVLRLTGNKTAAIYDGYFNTAVSIITSGNIGSQSVASAAKLTTPRTIWGQSFDGTGDVSGHMMLTTGFDVGGVNMFIVSDKVYVGSKWYNSVWKGISHSFEVGDSTQMVINSYGNVLIGTTADNGAKLQVNYTSLYTGIEVTKESGNEASIGFKSDVGRSVVGIWGSGLNLWNEGLGTALTIPVSSNNVLIGTTVDNGAKLHIDGDISLGYYRETSISAKDNYLSLSGAGDEICISGITDKTLYVNYRKNHNGHAPKIWLWKAGSSDSWAEFDLGKITFESTINIKHGNTALEVETPHGKSWFGMMNISACHIYTDAPMFYMNKLLSVPELNSRGNIVATGSVTAKSSSDYRLKCAFDYNVDYQERLLSLGKVCDFNYTPHAQEREFAFADDKRHTSVIWQDARKANITGFCSVEEDGYGTINPLSSDLIFTMVGAIQQGIVKTERIEERVVRLEKENAALRKEINDMKGGRYGC